MNFILKPLLKGNILSNAAFWKNLQSLVNVVAVLAPAIGVFFPELNKLTEEDYAKIISAVGAINTYLTAATSEKVGL